MEYRPGTFRGAGADLFIKHKKVSYEKTYLYVPIHITFYSGNHHRPFCP